MPASAIEFPGHIADVVYVGGCNFRCPYCYNVDLVTSPDQMPDLRTDVIIREVGDRRRLVDGLVITGGEPTLQGDLLAFLREVRHSGVSVKLDTNGYRPEVLQDCLQKQLVDYVAMDVKTSLAKYDQAAGVAVDTDRLLRSIELLLRSEIDYEFRTTVVGGLVDLEDVEHISRMIAGAKRYFLQCFQPGRTVGSARVPLTVPSADLLERMRSIAAAWVCDVRLRGMSLV